MSGDSRRIVVDRETLIPIGVAVTIIVTLCSGVVWMNSRLTAIDYATTDIRRDVRQINESVNTMRGNRWTKEDMERWVEILRARNSSLDIPSTGGDR